MDDFKTVKEHAWSLPPGEEPSGMELIHVEEGKYGTFKYYKDSATGEYYYQSSGTEKFQKWITEKGKERKKCSRESRSESERTNV